MFAACSAASGEGLFSDKVTQDLAPIEARIIKGPAGTTPLNRGSKDQVKKDEVWTIYSPGDAVIDPATGANLGDYSVPQAVCRVKVVSDNFPK
ncbi:MAG: hypothetical protein ACLFV2_11040 [Desulfurivibrionaceae bacterium]